MLFEELFNALQEELVALEPDEVLSVSLDIPGAVTTALGVEPRVLALEDRIVELPELPAGLPDKLSVYAMARAHAQTLYLMASTPVSALKLSDEGTALRETLFADANALVLHKLVDAERGHWSTRAAPVGEPTRARPRGARPARGSAPRRRGARRSRRQPACGRPRG